MWLYTVVWCTVTADPWYRLIMSIIKRREFKPTIHVATCNVICVKKNRKRFISVSHVQKGLLARLSTVIYNDIVFFLCARLLIDDGRLKPTDGRFSPPYTPRDLYSEDNGHGHRLPACSYYTYYKRIQGVYCGICRYIWTNSARIVIDIFSVPQCRPREVISVFPTGGAGSSTKFFSRRASLTIVRSIPLSCPGNGCI